MASMVTVNCASCKKPFEARQADINRGWGKFCSKSCKAKKQTKLIGRLGNRTCAYCGASAVNAYPTNFDDGELATWSHRQRRFLVFYCEAHRIDAEMACTQVDDF